MTEIWDQLYDSFATITDPRVDRTKAHSLIDILTGKGFVRSRAAEEMKFLSHECGQFLSVGIQIGQ